MKDISNSLHYAVELISVMTSLTKNKSSDTPVSLREVASVVDEMSLNFLEQIARKLRIAGYLKVVRGPGGGYILTKTPDKISIKDLIDADILRHTSKKKEVPPFKTSKALQSTYSANMNNFYSIKLADIKGFGKAYSKEKK